MLSMICADFTIQVLSHPIGNVVRIREYALNRFCAVFCMYDVVVGSARNRYTCINAFQKQKKEQNQNIDFIQFYNI